jgi:4-amino-4-deoxy-L-arabinose transferase-like glycosyltransferase
VLLYFSAECALLYFVLLLEALRRNRPAIWLALGAAHALAFLAKAIAMPWLAISTVLAALMCNLRSPRRLAASLLLAFLFPAMVWAGWGSALKTKYGVFTSGYQLRANLMINWHRKLSHYSRTDSPTYLDTSSLYDAYMVGETSWSSLRSFNLRNPQLLPMIAETELQNIPHAIKETAILLSPAGVLALGLIVVLLMQRGKQFQVELAFTSITLLGTLCLVLAYCMLVFDGRYIIPVLPLLMAICSPMMLPASLAGTAPVALGWMQKTLLALLVASTAFFAVYWASPFRVVDRDFEISCYEAASVLKARQPSGTLVSIGEGPYPEHGVGFEAGSYVAYFAGWRLIGGNSALPNSSAEAGDLVSKVLASNSDAVVIWGSPADLLYEPIVKSIAKGAGDSVLSTLDDPHKGEVGRVLVRRR